MNNNELLQNALAVQKNKIISNSEYWISFIQTMSRHYKHNSSAQILIHTQFPDSTACADVNLWKNKFNRTVGGGKSIQVLTDDNTTSCLYDISQTCPIPGKTAKMPWIWNLFDTTLKVSYDEAVKDGLIKKHSLSSAALPDCLSELCRKKTTEYLKEDSSDFFMLIYESASYCIKYRCCQNESQPCTENLSCLNKYSADTLINTVNHIVNEVFSDIESIILSEKRRLIENIRSNSHEHRNENNQRNTSREMSDNERISAGHDNGKRNDDDTGRKQVSVSPTGVQGDEAGRNNSEDEGRSHNASSSVGNSGENLQNGTRSDKRRVRSSSTGGTGKLLSDSGKTLERKGDTDSSRKVHHSLQKLSSEMQAGAIQRDDDKRNSKQPSSELQQPNTDVDGNNNRAAERRKSGISEGSGNWGLPDNGTAGKQLHKVSGRNGSETAYAVRQDFEQLKLFGNTDTEPVGVMPDNQNNEKHLKNTENIGKNHKTESGYDKAVKEIVPQSVEKSDRLEFHFGNGRDNDWISESDLVNDFALAHPDCSFALGNAILEYLDEKQHTERAVGLYQKTKFEITAVIDGKNYHYEGRFDIGDGKGTGGGSLIDHIRYLNQNVILVPFLEKNSALTEKETKILTDFKAKNPIKYIDGLDRKKAVYINILDENYIAVQQIDDGINYSVYAPDMTLLDSGIWKADEGIDLQFAASEILALSESELAQIDDYEKFIKLADMKYNKNTEEDLSVLKAEALANIPDNKPVQGSNISVEKAEKNFTEKSHGDTSENYINSSDMPAVISPDEIKKPKSGTSVTYHIESESMDQGGAKSRFKANIEAIETLRIIESENRYASPEEQKILAAYTGWGGLTSAFDENNDKWQNEYALLKNTLSESEYTAARSSVLDSFYTPPVVIDSIYAALSHFGFTSGNILEPSAGIGNFLGKMPVSMSEKSNIYATEIESISGRIAQLLYPGADIQITGFERSAYPDGFFDVAIGNIPFGSFKIPDSRYDKYNFSVHDYFFAKTLDKVRPGGIIAFITSTGTLDKSNPSVRKYLAQRAELLGAVRLPNNTFKSYSGTEVTSDIIFLQKREKITDIAPDWVYTGLSADKIPINKYFTAHPEMILGTLVQGNKLYGSGSMVIPFEPSNMKERLTNAVLSINGRYINEKAVVAGNIKSRAKKDFEPEILTADPQVKNFTYTLINDKVFYRENSVMTEIPFKGMRLQRIKGLIEITECVRSVIDMQVKGASDDSIRQQQEKLNSVYDNFTQKFGLIHSAENKRVFKEDISSPLLLSLEYVKDGKLERKADIFSKRTIYPQKKVTHVDTASEALAVSISEKACVDLKFMAQLLGGSDKIPQIISDLKGVIYRNPKKSHDKFSGWETADEYLSGNIRSKISEAEIAAESDPFYNDNITALKNALPPWINAGAISVKLGSSWIDTEYVRQFIYETLSTPSCYRIRPFSNHYIDVQHSPQLARWNITNKSLDSCNAKATVSYGTSRCSAYQLIEDCLNLRDTSVYDWSVENEKRVAKLNHKETLLARQKQEALNLEFQNWIFKDSQRREKLVTKYNYLYNSIRPREYDGLHINFAGMNPLIKLKDHQKNAIARSLYGGNTLFAHAVGAGKSFEMIASAMEGKRLGLHHKSLIAVPNHMTEQFANDFLFLYPNANILVAGENDFKKENRQKLMAKISTGDIDAVILGHSQLIKIPVSNETESRFIKSQVKELTENIEILKREKGEHFSIREMEKAKKNMEARLKILLNSTVKDDTVTFEQLGVDKMFIDEADMFKNLGISTKMRNISGISANLDVQKTQDLFMKCQYLDDLTGGKGICFATGTPVSNSISEIFIMQKYLQADLLKKKSLVHFDAWAADFAEKVTKLEYAPEGTGFRQKTRLAKFHNLPELMAMFKEFADIKTADDLNLPVPECETHNITVKPTENQKKLVQSLGERAKRIHNKLVTSDIDNMLMVTNDGRKIGLDQRLINPLLPDEPGTKVNICVDNVFQIWNDTSDQRLTQLIFCDFSTPKGDGSFNLYDDIKNKLIDKGVPKNEVAFIHDAASKEAKENLFSKVRSGHIRILIGSTQKMGAGTNIQDKLIASHDLDCPWKPRDMEQRRGRLVRQGNTNKKVHLYRYVTQDTFDAYLFQTLETKQRFISQIMTSRSPARVCEDVDQSVLDYAEIKALCAGNPLIREKMELDTEISKLQVIKSAFLTEHYKLEDNILKTIPEKISHYSSAISLMKNDLKTAEKNPFTDNSNENFPYMTINNKVFTDRTQAGKALKSAAVNAINADPENSTKIGEYRGFNLIVSFDHLSRKALLYIKGHTSYKIELGSSETGNITKIDNSINNISSLIDEYTDSIEQLNFQLTTAKTELEKPFPMEQKLMQMITRQTELTALLNIDNNKNAQEEQTNSEPDEKPSIRSAIDDIQKNQNPVLQHSSKHQAISL